MQQRNTRKIKKNQPIFMKGMGLLAKVMVLFLFCGCTNDPQIMTESLQTLESGAGDTEHETFQQENAQAQDSRADSSESGVTENLQADQPIYVYVCGCVQQAGVYEVPVGSRVFEVIAQAGGLTEEASERAINLADFVTDGQQIIVPAQGEEVEAMVQRQENEESGLVNINTADLEKLMTLPGIGEQKAKRILEYRENNGLFSNIEDIKCVSGIGDSIYGRLKDHITV